MITGYKEKSEYVGKNGITSTVYLMDCMEGMKQLQRNENILAVVDPPYGIGFSNYERCGGSEKTKTRHTENGKKDWDNHIPNDKYFDELFRVSKNQIIWGGNYFDLHPTQCFIFWYKQNPVLNFADGELAWTSFKRPASCFDYRYYGNLQGKTSVANDKIHPTQKPVALYDWIFNKYAKPTDTILDTHLGSGSSRIAAERAGLNFIGFELDADYYHAQEKRFKNHVSQLTLF